MKRAEIRPAGGARDPLGVVEQVAAGEELLSVVRHDLRNKLATVRSAVYYIRRKLTGTDVFAKDPRIAQFLDTIDGEMASANETLNEGKAASLIARPLERSASAPVCVERAASLARVDAPALVITAEVEPALVAIDPSVLSLVVRCLIENAAEATPDGGVIAIRGAKDAAGAMFQIVVEDEGRGLPSEGGSSVFEPGFTTKPGHAGLGLAMASRAARLAGGTLDLKAGPKGVVAALSLPVWNRE